jgi:formylmethanofuran dehydrogenase subunit B
MFSERHIRAAISRLPQLPLPPSISQDFSLAVAPKNDEPLTVVSDVTCTQCGSLCDDLRVSVQGNRVVGVESGCSLGKSWFLQPRPEPASVCHLAGQPAAVEAGLAEAARLLAGAQYPLILGLREATTDTQRAAVALADALGAVIDTPASHDPGPAGWSFRGVSDVTCSLGEVKNRGDVVVFWGSDPATTMPRHLERYSLEPAGRFIPNGRAGRRCIVIDDQPTKTSDLADEFIQLPADVNLEAIWILRALAAGIEVTEQHVAGTGQPLSVWRQLFTQLRAARYGVLFYGPGLSQSRGRHVTVDALRALTRDLNQHTRFVCLPATGGGNGTGAANVLAWQTGYPFAVNLARAYPRFSPGEYSAEATLGRGEADVALLVGDQATRSLSPAAMAHLARIPVIALSADDKPVSTASVSFSTAIYGIQTAGTVYRSDGVALPLRPPLTSSLPTADAILRDIEEAWKSQRVAGSMK